MDACLLDALVNDRQKNVPAVCTQLKAHAALSLSATALPHFSAHTNTVTGNSSRSSTLGTSLSFLLCESDYVF